MKIKNKLVLDSILFIVSLLALAESGNIDVKNYDLDSPPKDLIWCSESKDIVLTLTENNSLYRSDDKGFSWRLLNGILTHTGKKELEDNENEIGKVSKIIQSPVDKNLVIFLGTHGINWIGEDCGKKMKALNHGRRIKEFIFHPTERNWGLASAFTLCEDFIDEPCKIYKELYVTKDLGENWEFLATYVVQFGWGIIDQSHINAGIAKERILVTYEPKATGDQKVEGWSYKIDFIFSDDFFKTKRIAANKGNKFLLTKNYLFVAQVVHQESQEVMLLSAKSTDKIYSFQPIETNSKLFKEHSYTFLDTSEGAVFLHINHFGEASKYGHIYISDTEGVNFSLSLKYNIRSADNQCDFEKVNSLEGVYMANVISRNFMKNAEEMLQEDINNIENEITNENINTGEKGQKSSNHHDNSYKDYIKTLISYNKGGNWRRINAPDRDVEGKKFDCGEYCYLNLIGISGDFAQFYSVESAAGLIIANGNVGRYLNLNKEEVSTFLSRDGGLSWFEIRKGSHIYEIGDHGALILLANDQKPTKEIFYSWDEGLTFETLKIYDEKILIKNIIIEPSSTSQHFVIIAEIQKKGDVKGIVIGLDFTGLHEPQCRNPDGPDTESSDYEKWTPHDGREGHQCLMGHKTIYIRKKREARCYNGLLFERKTLVQNCDCTEDDYECDVGYARTDIGEPCIKVNVKGDYIENNNSNIDHNKDLILTPPVDCRGFYFISKGYRKIPGNTCINGVKYDPITIACTYNGIFASLGMILLLFLVLMTAIFAIIFLGKNYLSINKILTNSNNNINKFGAVANDAKKTQKIDYYNIDGGDGYDNTLFEEDRADDILDFKSTNNHEGRNLRNHKNEELLDV